MTIMEALARRRMTRRDLQRLLLTAPAPLAAAIAAGKLSGIALAQDATGTPDIGEPPILAPTPQCGDDDDLEETLAQTEGPYFMPNSPERTSFLEEGITGTSLVVAGYVYSPGCTPIAGALLDFWHCDDAGNYDNEGYLLRGHQFSAEDGRYELTTILPGIYPGRTRHIHVKVQAPNGPILTSQLYFPDEPENDRDGIFDPRLVMDLTDEAERKVGFFTFVVEEGQ
jgi:protocatechuate 3,4-dioxygenase beta subunit